MIQEIKIRNFLSFRDETVLSFEASNNKFAEDYQVVTLGDVNKTRLLRMCIIYGYNASGKSNLLKVIDFLKFFWSYLPSSSEEGTEIIPFRLDDVSKNEMTFLELTFFVNDTKYNYHLEIDTNVVHLEKLSYYKSTQPIMLFERTLKNGSSDVTFNNQNGDKVTSVVKDKIKVECLKNMSFFVARNKVNTSLPLIDAAYEWIRVQLMSPITPNTELSGFAQRVAFDDKSVVPYLLGFLRAVDFNVTNISTDMINEPILDEVIDAMNGMKLLPPKERKRILTERTIKRPKTIFEHTVENKFGNASYDFNISDESLGTIKTFGIETALFQAIKRQAFLPIDEIENSLHSLLLEKILFEYLQTKSRSQVLITTHNDGLLDLVDDLIRKDTIWFTEKDKAGATDLYKLTDFKGVNRLTSIREAYRNKRFGATMGDGK